MQRRRGPAEGTETRRTDHRSQFDQAQTHTDSLCIPSVRCNGRWPLRQLSFRNSKTAVKAQYSRINKNIEPSSIPLSSAVEERCLTMRYDLSKYRHIDVTPCGGIIGAEIGGIDVSRPIAPEIFSEIRHAFLDHHVIFFRDQNLDAKGLAAFAEHFAPLTIVPYTQGVSDHPMVTRLYRAAEMPSTERNLGDRWHSDQAAREHPNMAFALYCVQAPPYGGDTIFASLSAAYDAMSPAMKELCATLIGIHSMSGVFGTDGRGGGGTKKSLVHKGAEAHYKIDETLAAQLRAEIEHPVVRTHPETGRPILYASGDYLIRFK
ncbi:MAG: TauD/TfdA family dioxygenase, partial [Hyphomicrobiales bacterium]